jgi:hypothetical protein
MKEKQKQKINFIALSRIKTTQGARQWYSTQFEQRNFFIIHREKGNFQSSGEKVVKVEIDDDTHPNVLSTTTTT